MKQESQNVFWKQVLGLALPVALQGLLYSLLSIVDQIRVGEKGPTAVVAVGLASKNAGVLNFVIMGLTAGLGILAAQHVGQGRLERIGKIQGMIFFAGLFVSLMFFILSFCFPSWAMHLFSADPKVITEGISYHRYLAFSYFPMLIIAVYSAVLRSAGIVKLPMLVSLVAVPLNAFLNYLLIFGHLGFPALGVGGSALATTLATTFEALVLFAFVYFQKLPGAFSIQSLLKFWHFDSEIKQLWLLTWPLLMDNFSFAVADAVSGAIFGFMGTSQTVAVTIMMPIQALIITFFAGFGTAASVMLGHHLGRNETKAAYSTGIKILWLSLFAPLGLGGMILLTMSSYLSLFHMSLFSLNLTKIVMVLMVLIVPIKVINMVLGNILSSGGETKFIFYISIMGSWLFAVPLGLVTAFILHWPIDGVFVAISFEEVIRLILGIRKMKTGSWLNNLVAEVN